MNDTRARFEEIWPVPDGIEWRDSFVGYAPMNGPSDAVLDTCIEWDTRLDTFTRCQETTAIHLSLIDELILDVSAALGWDEYHEAIANPKSALYRAKQIMEQKK